jgi:hypothetical protein
MSVTDDEVAIDDIVVGRLEFRCETGGLSVIGAAVGVMGEYVTKADAADADGCAAKGSATNDLKSMSVTVRNFKVRAQAQAVTSHVIQGALQKQPGIRCVIWRCLQM